MTHDRRIFNSSRGRDLATMVFEYRRFGDAVAKASGMGLELVALPSGELEWRKSAWFGKLPPLFKEMCELARTGRTVLPPLMEKLCETGDSLWDNCPIYMGKFEPPPKDALWVIGGPEFRWFQKPEIGHTMRVVSAVDNTYTYKFTYFKVVTFGNALIWFRFFMKEQ